MSPLYLLILSLASATEGMWLPEQAPAVAGGMPGLSLPAGALADPLGDPLGAIVTLGFCSASFVSPDGLVATNHHCVEGFLQYLSTGEANLHRDGYLAATLADERNAGPTAKLRVVEAITDVTAEMMAGIGKRTKDDARTRLMEANDKRLVAACEQQPDRRCAVIPYFGASTFRLVQTFEIEDVRVVWAPPMSLGQFGGDVDNWMWPRHGADGAFLRAYVAPDGSAAPYAEGNVPYRPPHHLTVNPDGIDVGDFVMVAGFPGATERHQLAIELDWQARISLPRGLARAEEVLAVLRRHMADSPEATARLGASESSWANGYKNSQGMLAGLARTDVVAAQRAEEEALLTRADKDKARSKAVRKVYDALNTTVNRELVEGEKLTALANVLRVGNLVRVAHGALRDADERAKPDAEREAGYQDRDRDRRKASFERVQQSLWLPAERELVGLMLARYAEAPAEQRVPSVDAWLKAQGGVEGALKALYEDPSLATAEARVALLDQDAATLRASKDPWLTMAVALEDFLGPRREAQKAVEGELQRLRSAWMEAKLADARARDVPMYDDANGSLRLTFGTVQGYSPQDGLFAEPFTTLPGLAAKVGDAPFDAPADVVARIPESTSSRFVHPRLGQVPVDFLSDLDITGGNSGSAILDGKGRFVGLAFDGNWESILSDWAYQESVNRCIGVDVRYLLWLLEGDPKAARLLAELGAGR